MNAGPRSSGQLAGNWTAETAGAQYTMSSCRNWHAFEAGSSLLWSRMSMSASRVASRRSCKRVRSTQVSGYLLSMEHAEVVERKERGEREAQLQMICSLLPPPSKRECGVPQFDFYPSLQLPAAGSQLAGCIYDDDERRQGNETDIAAAVSSCSSDHVEQLQQEARAAAVIREHERQHQQQRQHISIHRRAVRSLHLWPSWADRPASRSGKGMEGQQLALQPCARGRSSGSMSCSSSELRCDSGPATNRRGQLEHNVNAQREVDLLSRCCKTTKGCTRDILARQVHGYRGARCLAEGPSRAY